MTRYARMSAIVDRITQLKRENAIAYVKATQHLTGLPASGECFHLAHNWAHLAKTQEERHVFRHIKHLENHLWDASRVLERWAERINRELYAKTDSHYTSYLYLHREMQPA